MEANCYKCEYRGNVPGDAHSCCNHPKVSNDNPLSQLMAMLRRPINSSVDPAAEELNIQANAHGVRSGWFCWPMNFDPVWLENCDGFKIKE